MEYKFKNDNSYSEKKILIDKDYFKIYKNNLITIKAKIDTCYHRWNLVKKMIHDYEYIYTSSTLKKNISKKKPISRSYYKIAEILYENNLIDNDKKVITCLGEAPGGFIQFIDENLKIEKLYGITLLSKDNNIPKWNYQFKYKKNISLLKGYHSDGDLYRVKNLFSFIKEIGRNNCDIVTADGGFDYSRDYSNQEESSLRLIYSEIFMALNIQKRGGTFICEIFDTFSKYTINLIWILVQSYKSVKFYKPCMSRNSNSEKYVICSDYLGLNINIVNIMFKNIENYRLDTEVPIDFIKDISAINEIFYNQQKNSIEDGIKFIKNNNILNRPTEIQIEKAKEWCKKYKMEINHKCLYFTTTN